jgi:hypothetical protein
LVSQNLFSQKFDELRFFFCKSFFLGKQNTTFKRSPEKLRQYPFFFVQKMKTWQKISFTDTRQETLFFLPPIRGKKQKKGSFFFKVHECLSADKRLGRAKTFQLCLLILKDVVKFPP